IAAETVSDWAPAAGATPSRTASVTVIERIIDMPGAGPIVPPPARSGAPTLLDEAERPVHQERDQQQDHRERDRNVEVALAGLEYRGGGEHARGAADVAAKHHGGAHLGDHAAEA